MYNSLAIGLFPAILYINPVQAPAMAFPPPKPTNAPHEAIPLHLARAQSGFASPIDDYREHGLDLHSLMVQHPAATYFARAE